MQWRVGSRIRTTIMGACGDRLATRGGQSFLTAEQIYPLRLGKGKMSWGVSDCVFALKERSATRWPVGHCWSRLRTLALHVWRFTPLFCWKPYLYRHRLHCSSTTGVSWRCVVRFTVNAHPDLSLSRTDDTSRGLAPCRQQAPKGPW